MANTGKNKSYFDTCFLVPGVVTTSQITHATPAGLYAKIPHRRWQCDSKIVSAGPDAQMCKDIARQLVEDEPANKMKVCCLFCLAAEGMTKMFS